ncbi:MAG: transposase [Akkermansiaceae bacterium]
MPEKRMAGGTWTKLAARPSCIAAVRRDFSFFGKSYKGTVLLFFYLTLCLFSKNTQSLTKGLSFCVLIGCFLLRFRYIGKMRTARWLAGWRNSTRKPVFYHVVSRVVEKRLAFGPREKEKFRTLMRMQEKFTGCRITSYCLMSNHFHLLLEVPPRAEGGLSDEELLNRLSAIYNEGFVAEVAKELAEARKEENYVNELGLEDAVTAIHQRFTYRMHDLGEFMKGLLQRFTQWFNRTQERTGRLWEDRFKSIIVEDGVAAKTIAAYIDLNPVRAGLVEDPAEYRWSSYGEAIGGGTRGNGKTARAGLVRALRAHQGIGANAELWADGVAREYRKLLLAGAVRKTADNVSHDGKSETKTLRKGMSKEEAEREHGNEGEIPLGQMLRCRVRYFTDGAVIGSRDFVNEAFASSKARFGKTRKDGARKLRGDASPAAGVLWSLRDLKKNITAA